MKFIFILSLIFNCCWATSIDKFYGDKVSPSDFLFEAKILKFLGGNFNLRNLPSNLSAAIKNDIQGQLKYLIGLYGSENMNENFHFYGSPAEVDSFEITLLKIEKTKNSSYSSITYLAKGKMLFSASAFRNQDSIEVPLILPLIPASIFSSLKTAEARRQCADNHPVEYYDFFYYWSPFSKECQSNIPESLVIKTFARAKRTSSTIKSYPEYNRLYKKGQENRELKISIFMGYMEKNLSKKLLIENDNAFLNYQRLSEVLSTNGAILEEENKWFKGKKGIGINQRKLFYKEVFNKFGEKMKVSIEVLLSNTDLYTGDGTFHQVLAKAYKDSDVVIYDGHAGLGANLSLSKLPVKIQFDLNKYQIFYFNSCSSYPYYNLTYFKKKGGPANLDIITSGLSTLSGSSIGNTLALILPMINGELKSYQEIIKNIELSNPPSFPALVAVNGDEDNLFFLP